MNATLQGILPVLPTPFQHDDEVDPEALAGVVRFAADAGVAGVVFPGFASEVEYLTPHERKLLLKRVVESAGDLPVVAGASADSSAAVVAHGKVAVALGIRWLMIQPPKSIGTDARAVTAFMKTVCSQLPEVRIVLQNAPAPRGSDLSPASILEVAGAVAQIAYIKEETLPAGPAITAILADRPASLLGVIGGGGARYILDEYERGACAAMPAVEVVDLHVDLDRAWRNGDRKTARDIYVRTLPLLTLQAVFRMRLTKHTLLRRGVLHDTRVRAPTPGLDAVTVADIDANLIELGILPAESVSAHG